MNRRGFLAGILAAAVAPAIVRAASLMPVVVRPSGLLLLDEAIDSEVVTLNFVGDGVSVWTAPGTGLITVSMVGGGGGGRSERIERTPLLLDPGVRYAVTVGQ